MNGMLLQRRRIPNGEMNDGEHRKRWAATGINEDNNFVTISNEWKFLSLSSSMAHGFRVTALHSSAVTFKDGINGKRTRQRKTTPINSTRLLSPLGCNSFVPFRIDIFVHKKKNYVPWIGFVPLVEPINTANFIRVVAFKCAWKFSFLEHLKPVGQRQIFDEIRT